VVEGIRYWVGVDFGQANDYTAVSILERVPVADYGHEEEYHVRYLRRPPLRTPYNEVVSGVVRRIITLTPAGPLGIRDDVGLVVDATGVGRAVVDMLKEEIRGHTLHTAPRIRLVKVNVTGGNRVNINKGYYNVPKRDLISAGVIALQDKKLKIGQDVENRDVLIKELLNYRMKININSSHDSYEPWRDGEHDDLLFSVCLGTWVCNSHRRTLKPVPKPAGC
jgi:hypothetical protein